jgi:hypothetical protein
MSQVNDFYEGQVVPLPGVITSFREDIVDPIQWDVVPSNGDLDVSVDFAAGVLTVPLEGDSYSQRLQLRKLIEARVSPIDPNVYDKISKIYSDSFSPAIIKSAEQARINAITEKFAKVKGLQHEPNGAEKTQGKRLATVNSPEAWNQAVRFTVENAGTKSFDSFASGIRSVNPEWSERLRKLNKRMISLFNDTPYNLGDTSPVNIGDGATVPRGFMNAVNAAQCIGDYVADGYHSPESIKKAKAKEEDELAENYGSPTKFDPSKGSMERGEQEIETEKLPDDFEFPTDEDGQFAELIIDDSLPLTVEVSGYMRRKRKAMTSGRRLSYASRLITDPERRVFGQKVKVKGGIVVVDISGSMSLSQQDVESIVEAAPAAVIMAYSYCQEDAPNAWIFANRGWRVRKIPEVGHRGNGVDGPALTWAIRHRKFGEQIVWITDGQVTSKSDGQNPEIIKQCAQLVKKHRIIMVPSAEEAVAMFKSNRLVNKPCGPIRNALLGKL